MKLSQTFTNTHPATGQPESLNADLLQRGSYIDQTGAGIYSYLPLGLRVLTKISDVVREGMNGLGAQEVSLPVLHPKAAWEQTARWESFDALYRLQDSSKKDFALGPTHEEIITPIARRQMTSYRNFPQAAYQIQTKFRDEPRPRAGLLRGREFLMKDMYSFHLDPADLDRFYQRAIKAYQAVFVAVGLEARVVEASGGDFTKEYSHEFQAFCPTGEDTVFFCSECDFAQNKEIAKVKAGDKCPSCGGVVEETRAIEVGNIFRLGDRFSQAVDFQVSLADGKRVHPIMGCYGIGISRLMGAVAEILHDERGLIWPSRIAPAQVHLLTLGEDGRVRATGDKLYKELLGVGIEAIYDDRDTSPGSKFTDADLIGVPLRMTVSPKTLEQDSVELKPRSAEGVEIVRLSEAVSRLSKE